MILDNKNLGGWAIETNLFEYILNNLKPGSHILEFGSGTGTRELVKYYDVTSIEQNVGWVDMVPKANYIYAPLKDGWYNPAFFIKLPETYDFVLVDGPFSPIHGRKGLLKNLDYFNTSVPWLFDDINRSNDFEVFEKFCHLTDKSKRLIKGQTKTFGIAL